MENQMFKRLNELQSTMSRYFPSQTSVPWKPRSEEVLRRFYASCVKTSGEIILRELGEEIERANPDVHINYSEVKPQSAYTPELLYEKTHQYDEGGQMGNYDRHLLKVAYGKVKRAFKIGGCQLISLKDVPFHAETNAGLPTLARKADVYFDTLRRSQQILDSQRKPQPCTMFHRTRSHARGLFGYPFEMTLIEGMAFYPFQSKVLNHHTPYIGGNYDFEVAAAINEVRSNCRFILEMDYSGFDGSISTKLINMAFDIICQNFDMEDPFVSTVWRTIRTYFVTCPILCPDGRIYFGKRHGVPSGSNWTQVIDSIVNALAHEYIMLRLKVGHGRYYVLGDDSIAGLHQPVDIGKVKEYASELGLKVSTDKTRLITNNEVPHFLGHDYDGWNVTRPVEETLSRVLAPERSNQGFFSKNPERRRLEYIQRCRAYQDDNPKAWIILDRTIRTLTCDYEQYHWMLQWRQGKRRQPDFLTWFHRDSFYFSAWTVEDDLFWKRARITPTSTVPVHRGETYFL